MTLRAAVLGCGWIGSEFRTDTPVGIYNHAAAYQACPETELAAICDTDPAKVQRAGDRWQVPGRYTDARELFAKAEPEIVSICTPDAAHFDGIKTALSSSSVRGILAEKPLALGVEQAEELVELSRARGVPVAVNYSRRYSEGHAELCAWIRSGGLGAIVTVGGFYTKGTLHNRIGSIWRVGSSVNLRKFAGSICWAKRAPTRRWMPLSGLKMAPMAIYKLTMPGPGPFLKWTSWALEGVSGWWNLPANSPSFTLARAGLFLATRFLNRVKFARHATAIRCSTPSKTWWHV